MSKATPGLRKRQGIWHIEKVIFGQPVFKSTGETELDAAERYLAHLTAELRETRVYGERIQRTFDEAAARFVEEYGFKRSIDRDIVTLKAVMPYIGQMQLLKIHSGVFDEYIRDRKKTGITAGTLNRDMAIIRRLLSLSARMWRDEQGRPWLDTVPMLPLIQGEKRKPRPISWNEQDRLLKALPEYLAEMALFALNTGLRDQEICGMKWLDECNVQGLDATVFIISQERAKNEHSENTTFFILTNAQRYDAKQIRRNRPTKLFFDEQNIDWTCLCFLLAFMLR